MNELELFNNFCLQYKEQNDILFNIDNKNSKKIFKKHFWNYIKYKNRCCRW